MTVTSRLEIRNSASETVAALLRKLMETDTLDALLLPLRLPSGNNVAHTLVRNPARLEGADPFAPVMPVTASKLAGQVTKLGAAGRVGLVLRSCELRGFVELVKLQQASMENVTTIGLDCLGSYEMTDYTRLLAGGADPTAEAVAAAAEGRVAPHEGYQFRTACQMCEHPTPGFEGGYRPDIAIGLIGVGDGLLVEARDDLAETLGLTPADVPAGRAAALQKLVAARTAERDRRFAGFRAQVNGLDGLLDYFSTCIRCHNCMIACPICYCPECIFRTPTFDHTSAQYFKWAERKGAIRLPSDTLIFHITRMNHMSTSCVGCGMCTSACPNDIPVATAFRAVAEKTQALYDYIAGRSLEEEVPLATFREDELTALGERPG
ncbi:MAG: 4Fe-4S dicluster domain-containing protein [Chloroflexota bacterium]